MGWLKLLGLSFAFPIIIMLITMLILKIFWEVIYDKFDLIDQIYQKGKVDGKTEKENLK